MKKLMIAALGLSILSGSALFAAQDTSTTDTTVKKSKKSKKSKKGTTDTMGSTTAAPK